VEEFVAWERAYTKFGSDKHLWQEGGITPLDIRQGAIGNCWFIGSAGAVAEIPHRLEQIFLNTSGKLNTAGIYGVNLYTLGVPNTIIVDDMLPLYDAGEGVYKTLFAQIGENGNAWGTILEKAFAKAHGNYEHIIAGSPADALRMLTGSPSIELRNAELSADEMWAELKRHDLLDEMIMLNTPGGFSGNTDECGLVNNHAYIVLQAKQTSNGDRLLKMRNPWGFEKWTCDWSDLSDKWTQTIRDELNWQL